MKYELFDDDLARVSDAKNFLLEEPMFSPPWYAGSLQGHLLITHLSYKKPTIYYNCGSKYNEFGS